MIYEIFVRNHGPHGTFTDVEVDLPRIRSMGVDVVWFMPIHPIGEVGRKGSLGSPYSIQDYRAVNPEYGTLDDLSQLIRTAHELGLRVMIDVVYNHTAHDSRLAREHPEYFHTDDQGRPVTTVPEWGDVIDLKHPHPGLTAELTDTLTGWAQFGVDGFRCDVASLVPVPFWQAVRQTVARVKPDVIWLAESVHAAFIGHRRAIGLSGCSDSELYAAFDLTYDYDIWPIWHAAVTGRAPVLRYLEMLRFQDSLYPANFIKMRCAENHDQARIMKIAPSYPQALAWTAFQAFNRGAFLIYAGQEAAAQHTPSLFDVDKIEWGGYPLQSFLGKLARLKKDPAQVSGRLVLIEADPAIQAVWSHPEGSLYGVFNVGGARGAAPIPVPDGDYLDLLSGEKLTVAGGSLHLPESAAIFRIPTPVRRTPVYSELLDFQITPT